MHKVAPEVQHAIGIPQLHIVDPCAEAAIADGANTLGLLVTAPVMETGFTGRALLTSGSKSSFWRSVTAPSCTVPSSRS
jgi:aspartate racemase